MTKMMIRIKKKNIIYAFLFIIIILYSGSALQTVYPSMKYLIYVLAIYSLTIIIFRVRRVKKDLRIIATIIFSYMLLQTYITHNKFDYSIYIIYYSLIIIALYVSMCYDIKIVSEIFVKFMLFITVVSVVAYFLVNYTSILTFLPSVKNTNGVVYKMGLFFNYLEIEPTRNCSIFWEPGLFVTNITWAMLSDIIILKKKKISHIIIFSLGIFTAKSSAGYALWFLIILLVFLNNKNDNSIKKSRTNIYKSIFSSVILIFGILVILNLDSILTYTGLIENPYFYKLSSNEITSSSRLLAIEYNIQFFLRHPLWGQGFDMAYKTAQLWCDTSTSTFFMNVFGWLGIAYTFLWGIAIFKMKKTNFNSKIVVFFIVLSILNKEPHGKLAITWVILYFLLKSENVGDERIAKKNE